MLEISDEVYINSMNDISKHFQIMLDNKDKKIAELEQDLEFTTKTANDLIEIKHKLEQELAELKEKEMKRIT